MLYRICTFLDASEKANRDRHSGILRYFAEHPKPSAVVINVTNKTGKAKLNAASKASTFNGFIGIPNPLDETGFMHKDIPLVRFGTVMTRLADNEMCVCIDDDTIGTEAAEILIRRGYGCFAYVGLRPMQNGTVIMSERQSEILHSNIREAAFRKRVEARGLRCSSFGMSMSRRASSLQSLAAFIQTLQTPCGIMAYNDEIAQDVYNACRIAELSIPDQIGVVGVDNAMEICEMLRPTLTSILPDFEQSGHLAAEMLMRSITGSDKAVQREMYGIRQVFERESTQDIDGAKRLAAKVRSALAKNFMRRLTTADIAASLNISRRSLETKFLKATGSTIHEETERIRTDEAKRLLASTKRSVSEIAAACGYASDTVFRAAFVRRVGTTPQNYRKSTFEA